MVSRARSCAGVSFRVAPGEAYGLVGESGCGKSTTAFAALRYLPANGRITAGHVKVAGDDVTIMNDAQLRSFRARHASMVYQDPGGALNPTLRIGPQVIECFTLLGHKSAEAERLATDALRRVRIADPESVMSRYPYQLSGGMQQRVVIAMALACDPQLLVLDEPTTGLDATVEAEVLDLVKTLRKETSAAILLIAHNLGVIRAMCDRVGVMYAGRSSSKGRRARSSTTPSTRTPSACCAASPATASARTSRPSSPSPARCPRSGRRLPACVYVDRCALATEECRTVPPPRVDVGEGRYSLCHHTDRLGEIPDPASGTGTQATSQHRVVLSMNNVSKTFKQSGKSIPALVGVDLGMDDGETLGLVGESGSGKSTLAKAMLGIHAPDAGSEVTLDGEAIAGKSADRPAATKRAIQMVFQNPDSALNRNWTVRRILKRSVVKLTGVKGKKADDRVAELASALRLSPRHLDLKPRQLSGGLKQRVAIARAFAGDPRVVVCDEPTSALDVSVQAAILNLLAELQSGDQTSYLFISHDLGVVRYLADRIAVMYVGRTMELGPTDAVFAGPHHPYTEALLSAVPSVDGETNLRIHLTGEIPSPADPPSGCVFHTRCHRFIEGLCETTEPPNNEVEPGHTIRCHIPVDELRRLQQRDGT